MDYVERVPWTEEYVERELALLPELKLVYCRKMVS